MVLRRGHGAGANARQAARGAMARPPPTPKQPKARVCPACSGGMLVCGKKAEHPLAVVRGATAAQSYVPRGPRRDFGRAPPRNCATARILCCACGPGNPKAAHNLARPRLRTWQQARQRVGSPMGCAANIEWFGRLCAGGCECAARPAVPDETGVHGCTRMHVNGCNGRGGNSLLPTALGPAGAARKCAS